MMEKSLSNSFARLVRRRILVTLEIARPEGAGEPLLIDVLNGSECATMPFSLRRDLDFLEVLGLIKIEKKNKNNWVSHLTADGIKVVQGLVDTPEGIAPPEL